MSEPAISVRNLSKCYRLGVIGRHTLVDEVQYWWHKVRGRDPRDHFRQIGHTATEARKVEAEREGAEQFWALKDISFDVQPGEVVGIIGRNGAGKSTLLKILTRITEPTSGDAFINGRVASLLEVGTGFHPELSGRENIYMNGTILGMKKREIDSKFDEIVAFSEIEEFLDTPVKRYSSGMYVRLAFAVAAHLEPEILLVDEVLAVGDAEFQKKCLGKMSDIAKQGRTVLFISHNMNAIEELCGSAILLSQGQILEEGRDVRGIIDRYVFAATKDRMVSEWLNPDPAPGHPAFKPQRFAITDGRGHVHAMPARNDDELWVEIEGWTEKPHPSMNVGYALFNKEGRHLYWSLTTDGPEECWPRPSQGHWVVKSRLPHRLLNEGDYYLELIASLHCRGWLIRPGLKGVPAIPLNIRGGLSDSPFWVKSRPGLLAPELKWELAEARTEDISK